MSGGGGGDKTEKATPKRRKKARHDGQIGNTPELGMWLGFLAATFLLPHVFQGLFDVARTAIVEIGSVIENPEPGRRPRGAPRGGRAGVAPGGSPCPLVLPLAGTIALIGVASVAAQGGIWISPKLLKPQVKRMNP